jgi:DNA-binding transcriptional MerR regulator
MGKYRAIPEGYMTVGEMAKKMNITVRTLQYYDREGILCPSAESEGGRRLYTNKDLIKLFQILSLKSLGFSLEDIKKRLIPLDTPEDVAGVLSEQADDIRRKIEALSESLREIELLKAEVLQMKSVNFKKYSDIIINLQMKNEFYWLIKHFDDRTLEHIRGRFDRESGLAFMNEFSCICDETMQFKKEGVLPESERAQALAKRYWDMIMEFTDGDMSLLPNLMEAGQFKGTDNEWTRKQADVNAYIGLLLDVYFTNLGVNPFEGGTI